MVDDNRHNKISGKTEFSGRRRKVTRVSGYKSHPSATGGHFKRSFSDLYPNKVKLSFIFPMGEIDTNFFYGFKFFFRSKDSVFIESDSPIFNKKFVTEYNFPNWNKCSNLIRIDQSPKNISIILTSNFHPIEIYGAECGFAWDEAMLSLSKKSLDRFGEQSAECIFLNDLRGSIEFDPPNPISKNEDSIFLKECNRCSRFLPINYKNERNTLSFSNHHSQPICTHTNFSNHINKDTKEEIKSNYGFQLECRYCKKLYVNGPLNPMRTTDQMKEDSQRRRSFELLISHLNKESKSLSFRHKSGKELSSFIYNKFKKKCFNCGQKIKKLNEMHLDHTRPLALLWDLDESATCLCPKCNSSKRDRYPCDFYDDDKILELSIITEIPYKELIAPSVNLDVIDKLLKNLDWFFDVFILEPHLTKVRDGKRVSENICKSLDKALTFIPEDLKDKYKISFLEEYKKRNF